MEKSNLVPNLILYFSAQSIYQFLHPPNFNISLFSATFQIVLNASLVIWVFLEWQPAASPLQRTSKRPQQFLALSGKLGHITLLFISLSLSLLCLISLSLKNKKKQKLGGKK